MLQTNRRRKQSGANTPSPSFCLTERQWFDCGLSTPLLVPLCTELYTVSIAVHTVCGKESSYCHSFVEISGCWSVSGFKIHGFYGCKFNKLCCSMLNSDWGNANCIVEVFFMSGKRGVMNAIFYKLLKKKIMCTMAMYYCHLYLWDSLWGLLFLLSAVPGTQF